MAMNKLPSEKRAQILAMMVEGVSIRAISRMTGASKNTIVKLLADAGEACLEYQDKALRNLPCKRIQADEIWSFVYAKQKNVPKRSAASLGMAMFGRGRHWMRIASSSFAGISDGGTLEPHTRS